MNKGLSELIELTLLVAGVVMLVVVLWINQANLAGKQKAYLEIVHRYERLYSVIPNFYYTKVPFVEKSIAQMIGDLISTRNKRGTVDYGQFFGSLNVTRVIVDSMNSWYGNSWHLVVKGKQTMIELGNKNVPRLHSTYVLPLAVPGSVEGEIIYAKLEIW